MPRVGLFITCLTDQFFPRTGVAIVKILRKLGCEVDFPPGQTCCGQPFFNNGFHTDARALAGRMISIFQPYEYIVTPSGSCCAMVREHFPELLPGDESCRKLTEKTFEFVEFLDRILKVDFSKFNLPRPARLTYHYTCHLRGIGVNDTGAHHLRSIANVEFTPMEKTDQCCGFGGTFAVKYPAISGAIVEDKTNCIAATGAKEVVCNDAGCTMNIAGMCHRRGMDVNVVHIAELLAEAMGLPIEAL